MTKTLLATLLAFGAVTAHAESATYAVDPSHTAVIFEATHFGTSTLRGRFDRKQGSVSLDRTARSGRVELSLDIASINTGVASFNQHLQGPDEFDAANFPTATFVGDRFVFDGDRVGEVAGTLTLHGQAHPVTLKATHFGCYLNPLFKREVCGGDFEATIQRSRWGLTYGPNYAADDVRLLVQVEAIKQ